MSAGRAEQPFTVHVVSVDGEEFRLDARAVIDASGTWSQPNPAGADGYPALGERAGAASGRLTYRPPTTTEAEGLAGQHVVVVGSGHSAMTAVVDLAATSGASSGRRRGCCGAEQSGTFAAEPRRYRSVVPRRAGRQAVATAGRVVTGAGWSGRQTGMAGSVVGRQGLPAADK